MGHLSYPHEHSVDVTGGSILVAFPKHLSKKFFESLFRATARYKERDPHAKIEKIEIFLPQGERDPGVDPDRCAKFTFRPENGKCRVKISYDTKRRGGWLAHLLRWRPDPPGEPDQPGGIVDCFEVGLAIDRLGRPVTLNSGVEYRGGNVSIRFDSSGVCP